MQNDTAAPLPPMEARATPHDRCDICGGGKGVLVSALTECWLNPDSGFLIPLLTFRGIYLCVDCLEPDGGIISRTVADGFVTVRTGTDSPLGGRIVVIQTTPWKH